MSKAKTGVQEWAKHSFNFQKGCANGCKYCYARRILHRFEPDVDFDNPTQHLTNAAAALLVKTVGGVIMFPTMHDISSDNKRNYEHYLHILLSRNNKVLIVTKGNKEIFEVIDSITTCYPSKLCNIELRVTITSANNDILKRFEPNAPSFSERLKLLKYAKGAGFKISISCEPMLDISVINLLAVARDFDCDIWFGLANGFYEEGMPKLNDNWVQAIINTAKKHNFIKLKDSLTGKRGKK